MLKNCHRCLKFFFSASIFKENAWADWVSTLNYHYYYYYYYYYFTLTTVESGDAGRVLSLCLMCESNMGHAISTSDRYRWNEQVVPSTPYSE